MAIQTTYGVPSYPSPGTIAGQNDNSRVSTRINQDTTEITFGRAVSLGDYDRGVIQGGSLEDFVGCVVRDVTTPPGILSVIESGDVWVEPSGAVAIGDPVYYHIETGVFSSSSSGNVGPVKGARFKTSCDSGGRAILSLPTYILTPSAMNYDPVTALGSDLIEYWDANRADTILATTDSTYINAVSSWLGLVNGSNLAQSTPNLKPTYDPTGFGGNPCVKFDGIRQWMGCTDAALMALLPKGAEPCELWALVTQDALATDATTRHVFGYADSSVINGRSIARVVVSSVNRGRAYAGTGSAATTATDGSVDLSGIHVMRGIIGATQTSIEIDGGAQTNAAVVPNSSTPTRVIVGSIPALAASNWWQGSVAALLITKPLSTQKAADLHKYLG